ncbi:SH2 domain-containing protein 6 isoform X3 [Pelodiscus sinensis]|uniref:SH2 domain-containing protein 6 isoform X3 n=1 Tax=Pelodiscus sinensis TaxID=13735 RepID=UPI003F6ADE40
MWGGRAVEGCVGVWGDGVMEACDSMLWGPRPCTPIRSQTGLPAGQDTAQCGGGSSGTQEPTAEPYVISFGGKGHPGSPTSHIVLLPGPSCHLRLRRPQTPPPPPKRPETWECAGPSTGEESDEGDTYEVPPCESQARKVAPAKRQEDADSTYLDHAAARRCSESYTQLPAQLWTEAGHSSPRRPAVAGAPCPAPAGRPRRSQLAPLHPRDRSLGEEVYLACELPSPPPCRAALAPRRLLSQVPPLRPPKIPKPKIILPGPEQKLADASPRAWSKGLACPGGGGAPQEDPDQAWYAGSCDRQTAESVLQGVNKDGAFMVRQSSGQGWSQPFTLAVLHRGHVYNIPIRYLASSCQYTLGKDRKGHEQRFASVAAMVQHYQEHPLVLIDGSSASRAPARLLFPAKP